MVSKISVWELLQKSRNHRNVALLLSNNLSDKNGQFELIWGAGAKRIFTQPEQLESHQGWALGQVLYSFKNHKYQRVQNQNEIMRDSSGFDFFEPEELVVIPEHEKHLVDYSRVEEDFDLKEIEFKSLTTQKKYIETVEEIKECIRNGVF